jgi:Tfp pilus assembly protein PilF
MKCEIYPDLGLSYLSLRKCQEALPNLLKAERCRPNELSIIKNIALSYQLCNRISDAHAYYGKALAIAPNDKDSKKGFLETQIQGRE